MSKKPISRLAMNAMDQVELQAKCAVRTSAGKDTEAKSPVIGFAPDWPRR